MTLLLLAGVALADPCTLPPDAVQQTRIDTHDPDEPFWLWGPVPVTITADADELVVAVRDGLAFEGTIDLRGRIAITRSVDLPHGNRIAPRRIEAASMGPQGVRTTVQLPKPPWLETWHSDFGPTRLTLDLPCDALGQPAEPGGGRWSDPPPDRAPTYYVLTSATELLAEPGGAWLANIAPAAQRTPLPVTERTESHSRVWLGDDAGTVIQGWLSNQALEPEPSRGPSPDYLLAGIEGPPLDAFGPPAEVGTRRMVELADQTSVRRSPGGPIWASVAGEGHRFEILDGPDPKWVAVTRFADLKLFREPEGYQTPPRWDYYAWAPRTAIVWPRDPKTGKQRLPE